MNSTIKLVIFDLDGTLVDAYGAVSRSLNYAMKELGLPRIGHKTIKRSVGWGERNLVSKFVLAEDVDKALLIYRRHHASSLKNGTKFLPGALALIKHLKQRGYRLAVASNRPSVFTEIILRHLKARRYFDCVLCADKVKRPKPSGDILKGILKKLAVRHKEALYVGDMMIDIEAGRRAKIKTVCVLTGSCGARELKRFRPFKIIRNILSLKEIINTV